MKRKDTRIHLVAELEKLPQSTLRDQIIEEAKAGEFHDYKNKKYDCGKIAVVHLLRTLGAHELAQQVINGEYDEEADEKDIENMRSFAPKEMWPMLGLTPKGDC